MSISQGRRPAPRVAEKSSNFSQTCNLLSQYLKENGGFGDLRLRVPSNNETKGKLPVVTGTRNLLPSVQVSGDVVSRELKSMDLFPQHAGFESFPQAETVTKEVQKPQMTIFYGGKVLIFEDLSADKAKEVMNMASNASSGFASVAPANNQKSRPITFAVPPQSQIQTPNVSHNATADRPVQPRQGQIAGLPQFRNASLHRFLEKRKDRIIAKAPYPIINSSTQTPAKLSESKKEWLGWAGQPPKTLEFKL